MLIGLEILHLTEHLIENHDFENGETGFKYVKENIGADTMGSYVDLSKKRFSMKSRTIIENLVKKNID